jgi:hypothetical protein
VLRFSHVSNQALQPIESGLSRHNVTIISRTLECVAKDQRSASAENQ